MRVKWLPDTDGERVERKGGAYGKRMLAEEFKMEEEKEKGRK